MNKKIKSVILGLTFAMVLSVFIVPDVSLAQCSDAESGTKFCTEDKAKAVPTDKCPEASEPTDGLVKCGRKIKCEYLVTKNSDGTFSRTTVKDKNGKDVEQIVKIADPANACKFSDMLELVNSLIKYILFLAVPIAAIMFVYAGILLVFSGGDPGAKTKAKSIFLNALIGLALVVGAVLIVTTILSIVGYKDSSLFF